MRYLAVVGAACVLQALVSAPAATGAPPGFYESYVLEPAATFVAAKPATVYCAATNDAWQQFLANTGRAAQTANGSAVVGSSEAEFSPIICAYLRRALRNVQTPPAGLAPSILGITHEAIHLRGERDEGATDCDAVHEMPRVAVKFFHVRPGKQLRALMTQAWAYRGREPAEYRTGC